MEDLIPKEDVVITMTKLGYVKRMSHDTFKAQNRGGKGIKGMQTIEEDNIEDLFMTDTHQFMLFFTNKGRVYRLKAYEIPEASRTARGTAIINILQLQPGEKVTAGITLEDYAEDVSKKAVTYSKYAKRKTIKAEDIALAIDSSKTSESPNENKHNILDVIKNVFDAAKEGQGIEDIIKSFKKMEK